MSKFSNLCAKNSIKEEANKKLYVYGTTLGDANDDIFGLLSDLFSLIILRMIFFH
jgi:hypothetical protein